MIPPNPQERCERILQTILQQVPAADANAIYATGSPAICWCDRCVKTLGGGRNFATYRQAHNRNAIAVDVRAAAELSDAALTAVIAREVAHAFLRATGVDPGVGQFEGLEREVDRVLCERWPFAAAVAAWAVEYGRMAIRLGTECLMLNQRSGRFSVR